MDIEDKIKDKAAEWEKKATKTTGVAKKKVDTQIKKVKSKIDNATKVK
ncbi:MAG: hypothetical protein ACYDIA_10610 [Candidatus Humimicrobiaceae bacterium]